MRDVASRPAGQEIAQRLLQIAAHSAAHAAIFEQQGAFGHALQQMMVEPDLAELIDEHGYVGQFPRTQQALQQRRLTATEEAGDDVDRREIAVAGHVRSRSTLAYGERTQVALVERVADAACYAPRGSPDFADRLDNRSAPGAAGQQI